MTNSLIKKVILLDFLKIFNIKKNILKENKKLNYCLKNIKVKYRDIVIDEIELQKSCKKFNLKNEPVWEFSVKNWQ